MLNLKVFLIVSFLVINSLSQSNMVVYNSTGNNDSVLVDSINVMTFDKNSNIVNGNIKEGSGVRKVLKLTKKNGILLSWLISDVDSINFAPTISSMSKIVFISNRTGVPEVWLVNSDGSGLKQLTHGGADFKWWPKWSPDGKLIAYAGTFSPYGDACNGKICIIDTNGTEIDVITPPTEMVAIHGISWYENGTSLLFMACHTCGETVQKYNLLTKTDSHFYGDPDGYPVANPTAFSDGRVLMRRGQCGGTDVIRLFNPVTGIAANLSSDGSIFSSQGQFHPNGLKIVFVECEFSNGNHSFIGTMSIDGTNRSVITSIKGNCPTWSTDGTEIVFSRPKNDDTSLGIYNVWSMRPDGSNPRQITTGDFSDVYADVR